ncbi:hypothetical protein MVEN_02547200 [Mycena venus]|uniref:Uncharacterized protein n=1 Tax=Mycena venus TaxID=2733690 RepID=A0A8H6TZG7_9AGAR|nr:hypothetical protein MVEN_02547200 [Mycena venus]
MPTSPSGLKSKGVDSEAGDTMVASMSPSSALSNREDLRNPTFVRYEMLIDIHANKPRAPPQFVPQTFYGQLQRIYFICLKNAAPIPNYGIPAGHSIIMVEILPCKVTDIDATGPPVLSPNGNKTRRY